MSSCFLSVGSRAGQSFGFTLDSDEKEGEESTAKPRVAEESSRERRERPEEAQRPSWERRMPTEDRKKRKEDSEPRLFMACDDNQDNQEPAEGADKSGRCLTGLMQFPLHSLLMVWFRLLTTRLMDESS